MTSRVIKWIRTPWLRPNPNQRSMIGVVLFGVICAAPIGFILMYGLAAVPIVVPVGLVLLFLWYKSGIAGVI